MIAANRYQRYVMRRITRHMVLYSEMVVANALHYQTEQGRRNLLQYSRLRIDTSP